MEELDVATTHAPSQRRAARQELTPAMLDSTLYHEEVELKDPRGGEDAAPRYVIVRPLNNPEAAEIQFLLSEAVNVESEVALGRGKRKSAGGTSRVKMNSGAYVKKRYEALLEAAVKGVVTPGFNRAIIQAKWPNEWVTTVGQRVMAISGIEVPKPDEEDGDGGGDEGKDALDRFRGE